MAQVEDRLFNLEAVLGELGSHIFRMEDGQVVSVLDEEYNLTLPPSYLTKYKTRLFRINAQDDKIILTPVKLQLESLEGKEK